MMTLSPTQPLAELSIRNIFWKEREGKGGRCLWPIVLKSGSLNLLEPSGSVIDLYMDCFTVAIF
jgi:hypothetical protein